jgi:hypothetical protein
LLYREQAGQQAGQQEGEKEEVRILPEQFPGLFPLKDPYSPFLTAGLGHVKTFSSTASRIARGLP